MPIEYEIKEARVQDAVNFYRSIDKPNITKAAKAKAAPYKRIYNRINGIKSKIERRSPNRKLSPVQEAALLIYIDRIDYLGCSTLIHQVHNTAKRILRIATRDGEEPPTLGRDWTTRFIASNPSCYKVKQKPLKIDRAVITDPITINEWYKLYYDIEIGRAHV